MLKLISMTLTCLGFMLSGVLLWEGKWTAAMYTLTATWVWFMVPRLPAFLLHGLGKIWTRRRGAPVREA